MHRDERFGRQRNQEARPPFTVMPRAAPREANRSWVGRQPSAIPVVRPPAPCNTADQALRREIRAVAPLPPVQAREQSSLPPRARALPLDLSTADPSLVLRFLFSPVADVV